MSCLTIASDEHYKKTMDMFSMEHYVNNVSNVHQSKLPYYNFMCMLETSAFIYNRMSYGINGKIHVNKS